MNPDNWEDVETKSRGSGCMVSNLPLIFARGLPTSLEDMTLEELEIFIPFMVKCSVGVNLNTPWSELPRPAWWPIRLPYRLPSCSNQSATKKILIRLVMRCYASHGCDYLLKFCSSLKQMRPSCGYRFTDNRDGSTSMFDGSTGKLLVTFRNENRDYDKTSKARSLLSPQKKLLPTSNHHSTHSGFHSSSKNGGVGGSSMMVQPPVLDVYLCDKCDDEFQSLKEVQAHEKICKGFRPSSPKLPSPEPEESDDVQELSEQAPFLSYLGLTPDQQTGYITDISLKKENVSKSRKSLSQNYLRFDSIDVCSPLGRYILSHCKYGGRLQIPEHFVSKYEKFIFAQPDPSVSSTKESRLSSQRWIVVWRPRRDEEPWYHLYSFTADERQERLKTIQKAPANHHHLLGDSVLPHSAVLSNNRSNSMEANPSTLRVDDEVSIKLSPRSYKNSEHRDHLDTLSYSKDANWDYKKIGRFISDFASNVNNGFSYLKNLVNSSIYSGNDISSDQEEDCAVEANYEHDFGLDSDLGCSLLKLREPKNGLDSSVKISASKANREIRRLLNDECRELRLRGLSFLNHLNSDEHKMTRLVVGKVMEGISREEDYLSDNLASLKNMKHENFSKFNENSNEYEKERNNGSYINKSSHIRLSPSKRPKKLYSRKSFLLGSSVKENINSNFGRNTHSNAISSDSDCETNLNYNKFIKRKRKLDNDKPKRPKLSRELRNIIMDECKELRHKGFHPSDILGNCQSPIQCLDAAQSPEFNRNRRPSLLSYKSKPGYEETSEINNNDIVDDHKTPFKCLDSNVTSLLKTNKKLSKELSSLMLDEWKEFKACGSHPSQLNNLLSLKRTVRSSFPKIPQNENSLHPHKLNSLMKNSRGQERSSLSAYVDVPTPRVCHRERLQSDQAMCIINYVYDSSKLY